MVTAMTEPIVHVIGGGLAGSEAAWHAARFPVRVVLHEMKPRVFSPAHQLADLAELVCSNSLRSNAPNTPAGQLKEEFLRSLMAGSVASELSQVSRESEEAFIGAMFRNLGRLLTEFYFPEEARQVRAVLADHAKMGRAVTPMVEESASVAVLGISFEELGVGVAKSWGCRTGCSAACACRPPKYLHVWPTSPLSACAGSPWWVTRSPMH